MAHEPLHQASAHEFRVGDLRGLCQGFDQVGADVIHGPVPDEGLEICMKMFQLMCLYGSFRPSLTRLGLRFQLF